MDLEVREKSTHDQSKSGTSGETTKEQLKKQKSQEYEDFDRYTGKYSKWQGRDNRQNDNYKLDQKSKNNSGSHSSSVGSTKDRDNSNSSSVKSSSNSASNSDSNNDNEPVGTYIKDDLENKTYLMKTSGTIIDVSKRRRRMRKIPMSVKKPVSNYVAFIKSPFKGRPPVVFFPYPSYVGEKKDEFNRVFFKPQEELGPLTLRFKISETINIYNAFVNACKNAGMYLVNEAIMLKRKRIAQGYDTSSSDSDDLDENEDNFNILFSGGIRDDVLSTLRGYQKINHFPDSYNLGRKDAMWKNIHDLEKQFPDDYNFCPHTYVFPQDAEAFEESRNDPNYDPETDIKLWIFKPSASSCGKGIRIVSRDSPMPTNTKKGFVISEYVANPHLIEGLKYDLRVYVLVTSYDPLVIYMYDDGLARFATEKYTLDEEQFENRFVHLTNYSIQKKNETFIQNKTKMSNNLRASKWSLKTLQKVFEDHGKDYKSIKKRMKDIIIKTLISVEHPIVEAMHTQSKHSKVCYELYGFDILIDSNLKPWILEVNISPSLSSSSPFDKSIKTKLICDALTIAGIKPTNHEKYLSGKDEHKEKAISDIDPSNLKDDEEELLIEFEEEIRRAENFELIFPVKKTFKKYIKFFSEKRYKNYLLWNHIKEPLIDVDGLLN